MPTSGPSADPTLLLSVNEYIGDGDKTAWNVSFAGGFISRDHVLVTLTLEGGAIEDVEFSWIDDTTINIAPAIAAGQPFRIYRNTPRSTPLLDFADGAFLTERNLDVNAKQAVFIAAEAFDRAVFATKGEQGLPSDITAAQLSGAAGSALVGVRGEGAGSVVRSLASKLEDLAVSVLDYMTAVEVADVRSGSPQLDVGPAINRAFEAARVAGRTVFFPDGVYGIRTMLQFGTNFNNNTQSGSPLGMYGQSKIGTVLRALPGFTGTLLRSWSLAGIAFHDFTLETAGTTAQAWDCRWMGGPGPSTQNIIRHIIITGDKTLAPLPGQTPTPHLNLDDLNDTYPDGVTVRVGDLRGETCGISMVQSGGLTMLHGCIWSGAYLHFGCQNGKIDACWGFGIEFATGCVNVVQMDAYYGYPNLNKGYVLWSEGFGPQESISALTTTACQWINDENLTGIGYFNLNLYSSFEIIGAQFIGASVPLLGPQTRTDSYASAKVNIRGGRTTPNGPGQRVQLNDVGGVIIQVCDFMDDETGFMVEKDWSGSFVPVVTGGTTPGTATYHPITKCSWVREGNRVFWEMRVLWNGHTGSGSLQISGLPFTQVGIAGVDILYSNNPFGGIPVQGSVAGNTIIFRDSGISDTSLLADGDLILTGNYRVKP